MYIPHQAVLPKTVAFPFAFWVLWSSILLDGLGKFVITFLSLYLVKDRHFSIEQTTLILSAFGVASIPSALLGGMLSDHMGHRNTVILGFWGVTCVLVGLGSAYQFEYILIAAMGFGLLLRLNKPAITALVAEIIPAESRKRAYHLNYWAGNLGAVVAMPLGGIAAGMDYKYLFIGDAVTAFGAGTLLWLFFQNSAVPSVPKPAATELPSATIKQDQRLWLICLGVFLVASVYAQIDLGLPLDMQNKGISEAVFGAILAINPLVIVLFQMPFANLVNRLPHSALIASGALLLGMGFGLHSLASTSLGYVMPVLIWTVGEMLFFPNALALVTEIAPPARRARYQGAFYTSWSSLRFIGAALGGMLLEQSGAVVLWGSCLVVALMATGIFVWLHFAHVGEK